MSKFDVIYCRVSSDEQAGETKTSIPEQEARCRDYLSRIGCDNIKVFQEDYSGFEFERPELDKIRMLIKEGKVHSITFLRVDRLSRQSGHLDQLREGYFRPYGIEVHSPGDLGKWEWTPSHIYLQNTLVNFSQMWGSVIIQIMNDGKLGKVKQGNTMAVGHAPFGYTEVKTKSGACFEINEHEASIVRMIFRLFVEEGLSLGVITKKLNDEKVPTYCQLRPNHFNDRTQLSDRWYSTTIRNIIKNPAYKGQWLYGKSKTTKHYNGNGKVKRKVYDDSGAIPVAVPPIIDENTWNKAQEKLIYNKKNHAGRQTRYPILLARIFTCSCGLKLASTTKAKGKYTYYFCPSARYFRENCPKPYFRTRDIDEIAFNWLANIAYSPDELRRRIENYREEKRKALEPLEERFKILDGLVDKSKAKYDKLIDLYLESDNLTKDMLEAKKQQLEQSITEHTKEREEILYRIAELAADFGKEMLFWPPESHLAEDMQKEFEEAKTDFNKRRKLVEKWGLTAELVQQEDGLNLRLTCKLNTELLHLYSTSPIETAANRPQISPTLLSRLKSPPTR